MNFDSSQQAAIDGALRPGDCLITGGAGTGKSTIIKEIVEQLHPKPILLCPTGKAAARLKEATGTHAHTIHRELMWDGSDFHRRGHIKEPVIIDEASMVDAWLMARLLEFNPPKIILVGDAAQLPPVGRGAPFHDLLKLRPDITHELTHCWRAQGAVHIASQAIRRGACPEKNMKSGGESFRMIQTGPSVLTIEKLVEWTQQGLFDPLPSEANNWTGDIMLAPKYGSAEAEGDDATNQGIHAINRAIRAIVNPSTDKWAVNDRVMCLKNFSDLDMWNGDLGTVTDIDIDDNLYVSLDRDPEHPKLCGKEQMREITHAYCLSVHKSQGSQFRRVFFISLMAHHRMLDRSLIYTAITRAREGVLVCGELQSFYKGINRRLNKKTIMPLLRAREGYPCNSMISELFGTPATVSNFAGQN